MDRARLINSYKRGREAKTTAAHEFDPLAATCLADLIEKRMTAKGASE